VSPPKEVGPDAINAWANQNTNNHHEVGYQQDSRFDDFAARRRRRAHAVRLVGGDPDMPGRRYAKPSTGLRASGFQEGFDHGARDVLNRIWPLLDDQARSAARAIVASLQEAA
jgi:hypothetical protein